MRKVIITAAALAAAGPACAQELVVKPLVDARLRSETVHQDGVATDAEALTLRVRAGAVASIDGFSALAEAQGTLAIVPHYYDGLHGAATRPLVGDPQNVALYRAQLQYHAKTITLTGGRQRIALDDERFVGAANFRQNGQTFDAARVEWLVLPKLKADVTYAAAVRTIWGVDGRGVRPGVVGGANVFANVGYKTPIGTLTGFAYLVDQDSILAQGYRLANQNYGGRFAGAHPFAKGVKLNYALSYATQSNYHRNPNRYRADYYLIDGALDVHKLRVGGGYEVLGAAHGAVAGTAFTSLQTPDATLFKFNGWADKFLVTPPNGLRDLYGSGTLTVGDFGRVKAVSFQAVGHRFTSDRLGQHYGDELDLLASAKVGRFLLSLRGADYWSDKFATNTRKGWVQVDWIL